MRALADIVEYNSRVPGLVQLFSGISGEAVTPTIREWATARYRRLRAGVVAALRRGRKPESSVQTSTPKPTPTA